MNDNPTLAELNEMLAEELARHDLNIVSCAIISGLMNDVTARAEAAEARVAELEAALIGMDGHMARLLLERNDALNRVDELEAAQGWRDFTERPPIGELIQIVTVIDAVREEPDGLYRIGNTSEWQAWRPAPQEPTQ